MKPIAWYDPTNGMVSTDKDSSLFTPLGQVWPLYPKQEDGGWTPERLAGMARLKAQQDSRLEQEPVAWISAAELVIMRGNALGGAKDWRVNLGLTPEDGDVGLYTTPPQRTWVGLTDDEVYKIAFALEGEHWRKITDAIEAKLKEKNS